MGPRRIGVVIRKLREAEGLTQVQLAKRGKVSQAYLSLLEAGQRKAPTIRVAQRLAKALGVPVGELLE
jgi:transcriptional regulator with XRE-family HTH domain